MTYICQYNYYAFKCLIFYLIYLTSSIICQKLAKCDFQRYPTSGCRNSESQVCDQTSQLCKCGPNYTINYLSGICLKSRAINESCMGSAECSHIPNAGCYGLDTEFRDDFWILLWNRFGFTNPGRCGCDQNNGFKYNQKLKACIRNTIIGSKCIKGLDCYNTLSNSICNVFNRCQCRDSYSYDSYTFSCKAQLNYDDHCLIGQTCGHPSLVCIKNRCKCETGFYYDKYKTNKCEPLDTHNCSDNEALVDCMKRNYIHLSTDMNHMEDYELIDPPRVYTIFVILALWLCLLFILGNAKRGLRLVEQAVRREYMDQASQYRQCDTDYAIASITEDSDGTDLPDSRLSLESDIEINVAINQSYPPPTFDEIYPNDSHVYSDDPPTYEEVIQLDKHKTFVV